MKVVSQDALTKLIQLSKDNFIDKNDTVQATTVQLATVATTGDYEDLINTPPAIPSQTGQSGKFLTTNGTAVSWASVTADSEIEWATFGTTTAQQIRTWVADNKVVCCKYQNKVYRFSEDNNTYLYFLGTILPSNTRIDIIHVKISDNTWTSTSNNYQAPIPAGTSGNIVTYSGTTGTVGSATINDIVPAQSGQSGKVLTTNGSAVSWTSFPTVDQTYSGTSTNAQSGVAVKSAIDAAISSVYKAAGSTTFANKPALSSSIEGYVYNVSDSFTTTSDFVEGAGKSYPAGTNIVCINTATSGTAVYKWDVLAGFVDLSNYQTLISSTNKLSADYISDGTTNKTVTSTEKTTWSGKQDALVSGTNIKTINSTSLLGSGDISITGLPSQTSQSGKFLTTNGTTASWANVPAEIPSQSGQNGKFLTTNGTAVSWGSFDESDLVHKSGTETITGTKSFESTLQLKNNLSFRSYGTNDSGRLQFRAQPSDNVIRGTVAITDGYSTSGSGYTGFVAQMVARAGSTTSEPFNTMRVSNKGIEYIKEANDGTITGQYILIGNDGIVPQARLASGGTNGQVLMTNGTTASWEDVSGGTTITYWEDD